jgi:hypothetical protein
MIIAGLILMVLTFLTLMSGVGLMVFGGPDLNRKYSYKIMTLRVALQFCCIAFLLVSFL